jgi:hypothetical protein
VEEEEEYFKKEEEEDLKNTKKNAKVPKNYFWKNAKYKQQTMTSSLK